MKLESLSLGKNILQGINISIEAPFHDSLIKLKAEKLSSALTVTRFIAGTMTFSCQDANRYCFFINDIG